MASNPWEVSDAEYQKNVQLFNQLTVGQPYMDAMTAKNALMRSNLPPPILAQIWALSDLDKDGRLDIREYSIAMRLAFNCLAGLPLPPVLPPSLLVVPSRSTPLHQPTFPPMPVGLPPVVPMVPQASGWSASRTSSVDQHTPERRMSTNSVGVFPGGPQSRNNSITGSPIKTDRSIFDGKQLENWAIPHHSKLKYSQLFNALDKDRVGFLSTQAARSALGLSGLGTNVLAHIWLLSDVNKDGKLSVEEYCISQYMIEMFKAGFALPATTPPELMRMCGVSRSATNTPELEPGAEPPQKTPTPKTFEDKRQDNFAKGQAELERRRLILLEEENRRKAEIEKKEREEEARRERERAEKERQLEIERQAELERQRILEQQREEEEKKRRAELEKRREEEERSRKAAAEKARVKQLQNQKQQESERVAQRQQREKTLAFQLQALDEKQSDLDGDIAKAKDAVAAVTGEIEGMRAIRDEKVAKIQELQKENQKLAIESQEMSHQLLQMQSAHKETANRKAELDELRRRKEAMKSALEESKAHLEAEKEKTRKQKEELAKKEESYKEESYSKLLSKREEYRKMFELLVHAQKQAQIKIAELEASRKPNGHVPNGSAFANFDEAFGATAAAPQPAPARPPPASNPVIPTSESRNSVATSSQIDPTKETTKCRALFAFEARTEDELSFEPGDVIIVFQSHAAEPGWRAGQLRDKVGWFPEAFVEPIAQLPQTSTEPPIQNMPPNMTPSCSLDGIPEENAMKKEMQEMLKPNLSVTDASKPSLCQVMAQFQWRARNDDDLSFAKGDVIDVIEKQEMKWKGRKSTGECGWFPKSYVKVVGGETTPTTGSPSKPTPPAPQYDVVPGEIPTKPSGSDEEIYVALFDFEAAEPTDLALRVGDKVHVIEKNDDWWKGRCNGKEGIFPATYVQKESPTSSSQPLAAAPTQSSPSVICHAQAIVDFVASAPNQLGIKIGELIKVREKSDAGWWEGETIRNGVAVAGWFPGEYVKVVEAGVADATTLEAVAMFDYDASQGDELSLRVGDVVVITEKTDAEWWTGHKASDPSKSGLFPANYVQLK
ncbi:unnamed protein product [Caenorhabditis bovis]|uniref:Intersectin-1 n=1 Tax=Caenorhabditis bovis TaxID=2654633 RepID=A0A8S1F9N9_9PELO|nr:unnamed protein product [Caenorhabditis bovis]